MNYSFMVVKNAKKSDRSKMVTLCSIIAGKCSIIARNRSKIANYVNLFAFYVNKLVYYATSSLLKM
jgi:hypothetical protein